VSCRRVTSPNSRSRSPLKDYYRLLEIAPTATTDEVKRAFRLQIARYHPDKVQHLGQEFQAMAAERAAELTEAYRILSDDGRRAEYDRARAASGPAPAPPPPAPPADASSAAAGQPAPPPVEPELPQPSGSQFQKERASRDEFVRKATINRLRSAIESVDSGYDETHVSGFDIAWAPKSKLFWRGKGPRLLGRFVDRIDREAVVDAWAQAGKTGGSTDEVCVLLMGSAVAPAGELARAIAEQRRRQRGTRLTLIPVDARNWEAHMPLDAPGIAKTLLARLRTGA
jgi:curved DNA-binding protein CbpA